MTLFLNCWELRHGASAVSFFLLLTCSYVIFWKVLMAVSDIVWCSIINLNLRPTQNLLIPKHNSMLYVYSYSFGISFKDSMFLHVCNFVLFAEFCLCIFSVFLYFWMLCDAAPLTSLSYPRNPLIPKHNVTFLSKAKITSRFAHFEHIVTKHIATFFQVPRLHQN